MSIHQTAEFPIGMTINPTVIGVSGTNGSGKDTVCHVLEERFGFLFVSVSELLRDELGRRGLSVERENLRMISTEWRRQGGLGVLVDKSLDKFYESMQGQYKGLAVSSLRNPGEAGRVHELEGKVIWVDADPKVRYERITSVVRDGRESEDNKSFEQFVSEEQAELKSSGDENELSMLDVKEKADFIYENNGSDIGKFKDEIEQFLIENFGLRAQ